MTNQEWKKTVIDWLKANNIDTNRRMRVYTYRGNPEVRLYSEPMEITNTRKSRRMLKEPTEEYNSTYGRHSRKISSYIHIQPQNLATEEERQFTLDMINNCL